MIGFSTIDGDVVVDTTIQMVSGEELLRQKIERVLATDLNECDGEGVGINLGAILSKNPDEDEIRHSIEEALVSLDDTFSVTDFSMSVNGRKATIKYRAANGEGAEVGGEYTYGG